MNTKLIVTNLTALRQKYSPSGLAAVQAALQKLIAADRKRDLKTTVLALDDATAMKALDAPPVQTVNSPVQNKRAIDAVFKALRPDYLLLLGSVDVIPHQDLVNPVFSTHEDPDQCASSDLPYACEAGYSTKPESFIGATRVVGRLPDLEGATEPSHLVRVLGIAAAWKALPRSDYMNYLGISAKVWEGSTTMSLENVFGTSQDLQLSPGAGPDWPQVLGGRRSHFINCHGATAISQFFGQLGEDFPVAHDASLLKDVQEGTVVAAECCYGAELYDTVSLGQGQLNICNAYLANKAYGYFGSTTIAYGPPDGNGAADLICQYFLRFILEGQSLGSAALRARQEFAQVAPQLDPIGLKTLAQFCLLGDPSIHPVVASSQAMAAPTRSTASKTTQFAFPIEREQRREQFLAKGMFIAKNQPVAISKPQTGRGAPQIRKTMAQLARKAGLEQTTMHTYAVKQPKSASRGAGRIAAAGAKAAPAKLANETTAFHVVLGTRPRSEASPVPVTIAIVAKEIGGRIVSSRELHSK